MYPSETYIDETKVLGIKQKVLSLDLKTVGDRSLFFKDGGSAFHAVGPETANPRGPKVLVNVRGMMRSPRAAERCDRSASLSDAREMNACCRDRRELKPERTDRLGSWELDHGGICRRGGRSCSSPGPPHPTSVTADAWFPTRMTGKVVAVPAWRPRGELPVVCQSGSADRRREARCSSQYGCVWAPVPEHEQRPRCPAEDYQHWRSMIDTYF